MAEKKYYWLKMTDQFFEDKAIKKLRKIAGGDTYTIIYLKMLLTAIKQGNKMYFEGIEDDFMEELALELDEDTDNVKVTVSYLKSKGLIEVLGADEILLTQCAEMVGSETDAARRKRLQRDRERNRAIGSDPVPALEEKSEVVVEEKPAKKKAENTIQLFHRLVEDYNISEPVREKMEVWFRYKMERKESYKEQGMKSLLKKTENNEGKGKLLATVEVFQAQMGVTNQKYHPLGTPLEQEILDSIGTTLTFTECVVEDGEFITDLLKMQSTGIQPNWKLQGVVKGINGSEERLIYPNCVPSGNIDLQNVSVGSLVKRQWSLFVNGEVKQQGKLKA